MPPDLKSWLDLMSHREGQAQIILARKLSEHVPETSKSSYFPALFNRTNLADPSLGESVAQSQMCYRRPVHDISCNLQIALATILLPIISMFWNVNPQAAPPLSNLTL